MVISEKDRAFIRKREKLARTWPFAGFGLLALLLALTGWLWLRVPNLVNPWLVAEQIRTETLNQAEMMLMAVMLPALMLLVLAFAFAVVLLAFVAFANERRLLQLLKQVRPES